MNSKYVLEIRPFRYALISLQVLKAFFLRAPLTTTMRFTPGDAGSSLNGVGMVDSNVGEKFISFFKNQALQNQYHQFINMLGLMVLL